MRTAPLLALVALSGFVFAQTALVYPRPKRGLQVDDYHGRKIADPFRELEDPNTRATRAWIDAEVKLTEDWLARIPQRNAVRTRLTRLYDYERYPAGTLTNFSRGFPWEYTAAFSASKHYFILRNSGLQNQAVLYSTDAGGENAKPVLDPNTLRADGTAALCGLSPSHNGRLLAYGTALAGSDWCEWRIRDVETSQDKPELIRWTKDAMPVWTPDNSSFYYVRYPKPPDEKLLTALNRNPEVVRHFPGQPESRDEIVYEDPAHPDSSLGPVLTGDGRFLLIHTDLPVDSSKNLLYVRDLFAPRAKTVLLTPDPAGIYDYAGNRGTTVYLRTTDGAPRGRIIAVDLMHPARRMWKTIIPEQAESIDRVIFADGKLLVSFLKDASSEAKVYSLEGAQLGGVPLQGIGTLDWSPAEPDAAELFYSFVSFTEPAALYRYDLRSGRSTLLHRSKLHFDPGSFETRQVFYPSKDGTKVPMFLVYHRGLRQNGQNPALLYGYGGFNVSLTPTFNAAIIEWLEMGGIYAVANLRGGAEYGEAWHQAGAKHRKQNVFDDFIAAAEWLIANHYTSTPKLAIFGGSNGGLLVGACLNQRPDLFGAAMPAVGVMDMLRFHKFTAGAGWVGEYGSPDDRDDFKTLLAYSPLHNIRNGARYPATLITTSDHDDRVVPGHSFKYAATLQQAQVGAAPILIRIETQAGHGAGRPTYKTIDEWTDRLAFLTKILDLRITQ